MKGTIYINVERVEYTLSEEEDYWTIPPGVNEMYQGVKV